MKKFILILITVLMCTVSSFARFHHHSHHSFHSTHHVVHRSSSSYNRTTPVRRTTTYHYQPRAIYKRNPAGNLMLYFIVTRNTHTYRHNNVDYVRCPVCKKVFIKRGQSMCSTCYYERKKH